MDLEPTDEYDEGPAYDDNYYSPRFDLSRCQLFLLCGLLILFIGMYLPWLAPRTSTFLTGWNTILGWPFFICSFLVAAVGMIPYLDRESNFARFQIVAGAFAAFLLLYSIGTSRYDTTTFNVGQGLIISAFGLVMMAYGCLCMWTTKDEDIVEYEDSPTAEDEVPPYHP